MPVIAGEWKQRELSDGTYDFDDLLDIHEMISIREENKKRAYESMKLKEGGN
jgi:hypothetical protein